MSYKTVEVELENGRVHPSGAETLPAKAHALLTIITPLPVVANSGTASPGVALPGAGAGADSLADRVAHLKGIGRGEYTDLSTNKRHMDDFGK